MGMSVTQMQRSCFILQRTTVHMMSAIPDIPENSVRSSVAGHFIGVVRNRCSDGENSLFLGENSLLRLGSTACSSWVAALPGWRCARPGSAGTRPVSQLRQKRHTLSELERLDEVAAAHDYE